ncbi:hypothetical protein M408DRAFT_231258 [Serendipita vermifera MAFF 305830]|uniref:Uncharacterized protein n=1 Tax=Serendipita vermifera MAFF 305830 TaxID=933852 RepID=A0A0C3A403_SERVB|nr:hypothetical protein M408DRAFT_231258 [Serendipita vermifera MAFF 305830]
MGQHQFRPREKDTWNVAVFGQCYSLVLYVLVGTEERSAPFWPGVAPLDTRLGCWHNGFKRPVLKHGPRSLTCARVFGC